MALQGVVMVAAWCERQPLCSPVFDVWEAKNVKFAAGPPAIGKGLIPVAFSRHVRLQYTVSVEAGSYCTIFLTPIDRGVQGYHYLWYYYKLISFCNWAERALSPFMATWHSLKRLTMHIFLDSILITKQSGSIPLGDWHVKKCALQWKLNQISASP